MASIPTSNPFAFMGKNQTCRGPFAIMTILFFMSGFSFVSALCGKKPAILTLCI